MTPAVSTQFGDIFKEWEFLPIPDVVFFQEGPGLRKWQFTDSGMKIINVANILLDGTVDISNSHRHVSFEEFEEKYRHFATEAGDTVVSSSGWSYGKVGRIKPKHLPLMMNTSVIRFHPLSRQTLDSGYLHKYLCSHFFERQIGAFIIGSHQPNFGPSHLKRMKIVVPPLCIQHKIDAILSAYDDLIENNTRRIVILEEMAQAIYREWFVNFRFPGHENVKLVDSELGRIPEGWGVVTTRDAIDIKPRTHVPKEGEKPFVSMGAVPHNTMLINESEIESRTKNSGSKFKNGDTLFARITPCLENGKTAFVNFLPSEEDVACGSTEFIVLRSKTVISEFVYLLARSDEFRDIAIKSMSGATGRQRVREECFNQYFFAHPTATLLEQFQEIASPLFRSVFTLAKKNNNLRTTRDLLLPKLISGKLDVEDLDIDVGMTAEALEEATA